MPAPAESVPVPGGARVPTDRIFSHTLKVALALTLLVFVLVTLLVAGLVLGPLGLATGLAVAVFPVPVYVGLALRVDRFEPEPVRLLAWTFFWGASAAVLLALVLESAGQALVGGSFGARVGELYGGSISAPVIEELAKGSILFAIYRWRRSQFDGVLDGIVYAAMVGLGFATVENVLYYGRAAVNGGVPLAATFFLRGVMAPFAHPVFTAMTGIGLGVAWGTKRRWVRGLAPVGGLLVAMILHSIWNTSTLGAHGVAFLGVFVLVMVPVFIALVVLVVVARRREGRVISTELGPEVASGALRLGDVLVLSRLGERRRMRRAVRRGGRPLRRAWRDFVRTTTHLAFLRYRERRGLPTGLVSAAAEQQRLAQRLGALRQTLEPAASTISSAAEERAALRDQVAFGRSGSPGVAAAGWYADPWGQARVRWWDGRAWTHHLAR